VDTEGKYTLNFQPVNGFPDFDKYYLIDSYLGTSTLISTGSYEFSLNAKSDLSTSRFSLSTSPVQSTGEEFQTLVSCFPNPVNDQLTIEVNSGNVRSMELIDNMGKSLENISFETSEMLTTGRVDVRKFSTGIYFVRVVVNGKLFIKKVIKY
jgi:hypothetical protein